MRVAPKAFLLAFMRKQIGKKLRFDVFKRDGFICQYCGEHPPSVILHVDHIHAVVDGGTNDVDNLITACEGCNLGKGATPLSNIPESLKDKALKIAESEAQIKGYQSIISKKRDRIEDEAWDVARIFIPDTDTFRKDDFRTIKNFIEKLGFDDVREAADIATSKSFFQLQRKFKYFCGICINKMRELKA